MKSNTPSKTDPTTIKTWQALWGALRTQTTQLVTMFAVLLATGLSYVTTNPERTTKHMRRFLLKIVNTLGRDKGQREITEDQFTALLTTIVVNPTTLSFKSVLTIFTGTDVTNLTEVMRQSFTSIIKTLLQKAHETGLFTANLCATTTNDDIVAIINKQYSRFLQKVTQDGITLTHVVTWTATQTGTTGARDAVQTGSDRRVNLDNVVPATGTGKTSDARDLVGAGTGKSGHTGTNRTT